ncbi:MAG TPA: hypothetical protein K8V91_05310 [[Clostridium] spiroforme]|uniref:Hydroxyacid dehydrogenase n=1 Tax=Thomasclavelia spiroformis TaxID=29348 RepID=A0A921GBQ3_9FIRM|nr:hypothetical protein [Thomasclavelia spiroformis]
MNLLVTGAWQLAHENISKLEAYGHKIVFLQQEKDSLPCDSSWVEGVICNGLFLYHNIEIFHNLRYIQLTSAGYDRVPMNFIKCHNIEIHNARGVYSIPMAEFAIAGVLQIYKQSRFFYENQKKCNWEKHRSLLELYRKIVCIVGCGSVGTECAKRFQAFGCEVIGIDLFSREESCYNKILSLKMLASILPITDVLILTLPLTEKTKHLINDEMLKLMKQNGIIVNIARGAVIDTEALIKHLDKLRGVVLDVFEEEPLDEGSPLWKMENVIITPHNSFVGNNNGERLSKVILNNISNFVRRENR